MMKYELQDLLRVRNHREDRAQKELLKAKTDLQKAEDSLQKERNKLDDFVKKKPGYIQAVYDRAIQKVHFKRNYVDLINLKISKLDDCQLKLAINVEKAQNRCEEARQKVLTCIQALKQARISLNKIEEHKKIWTGEINALDEITQEQELEDFRTKNNSDG